MKENLSNPTAWIALAILIGFVWYSIWRDRTKPARDAKHEKDEYARGYQNAMKMIDKGGDPQELFDRCWQEDEYDRGFVKACINRGAERKGY